MKDSIYKEILNNKILIMWKERIYIEEDKWIERKDLNKYEFLLVEMFIVEK